MPCGWMKKLRGDNRGSAIVSVVVAMVFVLALSAALLFSAYAAYQIKIAQRADLESFYDASAAMDEIRSGVQEAVSDSIASAYSYVLETYTTSGGNSADPESAFKERFAVELKEWRKNTGHDSLFSQDGKHGKPKGFLHFLSRPDNSFVTCGAVVEDADSIIFKNISVKYTDLDYETNITTDIVISRPGFYAGSVAPSDLNKYAIIANGGIIASGSAAINGEVFAGSGGITVQNSGSELKLSGGNVVTTGSVFVDNGAKLFADNSNFSLWTREISLGNGGVLKLNTNAYVADDLILNAGSSATITGRYFGFGSDVAGDENGRSGASSSIIVNSYSDKQQPAALDISGASVSLAGVSYVDVFGSDGSADVSYTLPMGQSLSVKSDQLAYLVPKNYLSITATESDAGEKTQMLVEGNPMVFTGPAPKVSLINTKYPFLWGTSTLADYFTKKEIKIKTLMTNLNSGDEPLWMMYTFLEFDDQKLANQYFTDYFKAYPDRISQYLKTYMDLSNGSVAQGAGATYTTDGKGELSLKDAGVISAEGAQSRYNVICSDSYSPFLNYVDIKAAEGIESSSFKNDGKVAAIVYVGDYTVKNTGDNPPLIIATGDVTVEMDAKYQGIIIAGGTVTINGSVTATALSADVLNARDDRLGKTLAETGILKGVTATGEAIPVIANTNAWDPAELVSYQNWKKH